MELETKYRDIADGNPFKPTFLALCQQEVGNQVPRYSGWKPARIINMTSPMFMLETKYRDIADGNGVIAGVCATGACCWKPSTAI